MQFKFDELIKHPLSRVYPVMRDNMVDVVPYLPNVESIDVVEREENGEGKLRLLNRWQGKSGAIPRLVRRFVTAEMRVWEDDANWFDAEHKVEWTFFTKSFDGLYECSGVNSFHVEDEHTTRVVIQGTLDVYPERLKAVPKVLARKARPKVEQFLIKMITPNLAELPQAVQTYLDAQ